MVTQMVGHIVEQAVIVLLLCLFWLGVLTIQIKCLYIEHVQMDVEGYLAIRSAGFYQPADY